MRSLFHNRWGFTILLAVAVLVLALAGGTWGTSQAASPEAVQAAPAITDISPVRAVEGSSTVELTIHGSNFGDATHARVRLYQWGVGGGKWEFTPKSWTATTIVVDIPTVILTNPNRFSVVVVNYVDPAPPVPTIPTIPTIPAELDPGTTPPEISAYPGFEEISNPAIFTVVPRMYGYMPVILV